VFNLGAAMYWALTGDQLPNLQGKGGSQMGLGHSHGIEPVPPWKLNPEVPQDLSHLVMRCCSKSPEQRPSLQQVRNTLHNIALCRELKRSDQ
jgi:serine/threonine protein kinase